MSRQKSTIVRTDQGGGVAATTPPVAQPGPALLRATFRTLERVAPSAGGALAERLWFRLPSVPTRQRRMRFVPDGGTAVTVTWNGGRLSGMTYGAADRPTAYLVHGWGGWWQQLAAHVQPLLDAGYRVVAYDAPSHGDSGPGRYGPRATTIPEMGEAMAAVVRQHGPAHLVVAHSIGAVASLWAVDGAGGGARGYAFLAPAHSAWHLVAWFQDVLDIGPRTTRALVARVERRVGERFSAFDTVALGSRLTRGQSPPALLSVHDPDDDETPASGSRQLTEIWPGAELALVHDLGHRRLLWDPSVVQHVAAFAARIKREGS